MSRLASRFSRGVGVVCLSALLLMGLASQSLANTVVFQGDIAWLLSGRNFSLQSGGCGYVPITVNGSTLIIANGLTIRPGVYAKVTGSGGCASVVATQVVLSATPFGIPNHVLTADYLGLPYGSHKYTWSTYARWLSWAEPSNPYATAIASTGIKTMLYSNPNRQAPGDSMYTSTEATFAHTCSGARITNTANHAMYLMNPASTVLQALWRSAVNADTSVAHYDAVFEDDANDVYGVTALPCGYTAASWLLASEAQTASLRAPVIYNGLSILSPGYGVSDSINLNSMSIGGMMEGCYAQPGTSPKPGGSVWQTIENTELIMAQQNKLFFCYANDTAAASSSSNVRLYAYASFLLAYNLGSSVLWEYFGSPSGFHVQPETALVAAAPVRATPLSIASLKTASGLYAREYNACYVAGTLIGACAAVVNPDAFTSHAFPYTKYHHTLVLSGGGMLDGGSVSTRGVAPPSSLPPLSAAIAFL